MAKRRANPGTVRLNPVTKTVIRKSFGEYRVFAYGADGKRIPESDYFTPDKTDAEQTAARMVRGT